jgi:hypothetical protein
MVKLIKIVFYIFGIIITLALGVLLLPLLGLGYVMNKESDLGYTIIAGAFVLQVLWLIGIAMIYFR